MTKNVLVTVRNELRDWPRIGMPGELLWVTYAQVGCQWH